MYTFSELIKETGLSNAVLQRYRNIGVLKDKKELRKRWNTAARKYINVYVNVYSEDEKQKIVKNNWILCDDILYKLPLNISSNNIKNMLSKDKTKTHDVLKLNYWIKKSNKDIEEAIKKYIIVNKYKKYFAYRKGEVFKYKDRIDKICSLLLEYGSFVKIPGAPVFSCRNKKYWLFFGFSDDEATKKVSTKQKKVSKLWSEKKKLYPEKYKGYNDLQLDYWIRKCDGDEETAKKLQKNRQITFSKEICIKKYGEIEGMKKWQSRQDKWQKTMKSKCFEEKVRINRAKTFKRSYSKISQELFKEIYSVIKKDFSVEDVYFATLKRTGEIEDDGVNQEFVVETLTKRTRMLDFYIPSTKKCIEFDGDYWHRKKDSIKKDKERLEEIENAVEKIKFLFIKEKDYIHSKKKIIEKCIRFLYEKN